MAGNPREHSKDKGFWDGGSSGQGTSGQESSGRPRAFPGERKPSRESLKVDVGKKPRAKKAAKRSK